MFSTDSLSADRLEEETEDESSNSSDLTWLERLRQDASQLKVLTLVDCSIFGLSKTLDAIGMANLEQLIIIYNEDCEQSNGMTDT